MASSRVEVEIAERSPTRSLTDAVDLRASGKVLIGAYAGLVLALTAAGLIYLHAPVLDGLRDADLAVNQWFADHRTPGWDDFAMFWSSFADTLAIVGVAFVAVVVLARRHWWRDAAVIVFALALEAGTFITVNHLVRRERPPVVTLGEAPTTFSFPSGHVAATLALYGALALLLARPSRPPVVRLLLGLLGLLFVASVGFARVYRGMHFLTDVLVGVLLGAAALTIALFAVKTPEPDQLEEP